MAYAALNPCALSADALLEESNQTPRCTLLQADMHRIDDVLLRSPSTHASQLAENLSAAMRQIAPTAMPERGLNRAASGHPWQMHALIRSQALSVNLSQAASKVHPEEGPRAGSRRAYASKQALRRLSTLAPAAAVEVRGANQGAEEQEDGGEECAASIRVALDGSASERLQVVHMLCLHHRNLTDYRDTRIHFTEGWIQGSWTQTTSLINFCRLSMSLCNPTFYQPACAFCEHTCGSQHLFHVV